MSIGKFPEMLSQPILVRIILVGRFGVPRQAALAGGGGGSSMLASDHGWRCHRQSSRVLLLRPISVLVLRFWISEGLIEA